MPAVAGDEAMRSRSSTLVLAAVVLMAALAAPAEPGMEVRSEKMIQQLEELDRQLAKLSENPVYEEQRQVQSEIDTLRTALEQARMSTDSTDAVERQIRQLERRLGVLEVEVAKLDEQRRALVDSKTLFPKTRNKVAVFAYQDPDGTGLSNAVSFLISKHMLFSTRVGSYAIVNFQSDLSARGEDGLTYFDRVDKLTRNLGYTIAVWGRIRAPGDGSVQIDTFIQIPDDDAGGRFARIVQLTGNDGRKLGLEASLRPERFQAQSLTLTRDTVAQVQSAANELTRLRRKPATTAAVAHTLPEGQVYNIANSSGDWVRLSLRNGDSGWTSVRAFCRNDCARLLAAADLANDVVAFAEGKNPRRLGEGATREALAAYEQMTALNALQRKPARSKALADRWLNSSAEVRVDPQTGINRGDASPPGGGAFANLRAIASLAETSRTITRDQARELADRLAAVSVSDPGYGDVLNNLAELFDFLGDERRKEIALEIAASVARKN